MNIDQLLGRIADYTNDAIVVTDAQNINNPGPEIVYVNPAFTRMTGYEPDEVIGQSPRIFQGPSTDRATLDKIRRAIEKNESIDVEIVNYTKKKHAYWVEISLSPVFDEDGNCTHYVAIEKDITDRKVMQEATEKQSMEFLFSEARTRAILYSIVDGIVTFEQDGVVERFSPAAEKIFGYDAAEVERQPLTILFPEEEGENYLNWFRKFCKEQNVGSVYQKREIRGRRKCGEEFLAELSLSKINSGNKMLLVAAVRDVTELKQAEEEARNQNRMVKLLQRVATAANTADTIEECFQRSTELICKHFNLALSHSYLYDEHKDLLVGTNLWHVSEPERYQSFIDNSQNVEFTPGTGMVGKAYLMNRPVLIPDLPSCKNFLRKQITEEAGLKAAYAFPVEIGAQVVAVLEFFADHHWMPSEEELDSMANIGNQIGRVVERKKNERQMIEAKDAAEASTRAKSEFLANMSHELRTPMNGILGLAEILKGSELDAKQRECLEALHSSGNSLLTILNDILDFSKIEAGELTLETQPFCLNQLLDGLRDLLAPMASKKGLNLDIKLSDTLHSMYQGDESRLQQILINLAGNAIKFTQEGRVDISVAIEAQDDDLQSLHFRVIDSGVGIPEKSLPTIFNKFTQADNSNTRKFGGTGLGLAISKQLVELMGGTIGVESVEGKGSTFWFTVPLRIERDVQPVSQPVMHHIIPKEAIAAENANILLVEDHPINRMLLTQLLEKLGITKYDIAENGQEAIDCVECKYYDLILMDCQMPEVDGYEAAATIRHMETNLQIHTPIIAMTANAMVGDREKCLKSGMDDYISKPIDFNKLIETVSRWLSLKTDRSAVSLLTQNGHDFAQTQPTEQTPVDLSHLNLFTNGNIEEEKLLFDVFLESTNESLESLHYHYLQENDDGWRKAAHRLKGAAANLGAKPLFAVCERAEQMPGMSAEEKSACLEELNEQMDHLRQFISTHIHQAVA